MSEGSRYTFEPAKSEVRQYAAVSWLLLRHYRRFVRSLPIDATDRVLDYCAGPGIMSRELAKRVPQGGLHVADFSQTWLSIARKKLAKNERIEYCHLRTLNDQIGDGQVDKAVCHFVLHEFPRRLQPLVIRQLSDSLRPGGKLYIREPVSEHHGIGADCSARHRS